MALVLADRVKVRSHTTGTGPFTLESVVHGFQGFDAVGDGNETFYGIADAAGNWEIGRGTYSALTSSLSRDSVISSSNSNTFVNFADGGKNVFGTFPSSLAQSIAGSAVSDSFKTIEVSGQTSLVADSSTDTLTIVAGTNITITTDALSDTLTIDAVLTEIANGSFSIVLDSDGNITYPGDITQSYQDNTLCPVGVDTVIYTSTGPYQHAIKLFVMVEGSEGANWETQACDIIAVKGWVDNVISVTAYGIVYSGAAALATFDGRWNPSLSRIEITCRPTSLTNEVRAVVHTLEMTTNSPP